ncbi:hypothetical protein Sango_2997200 [Sesamum angolense]|uniref:RING-type domain-containing protein n=1 Tax=Sesamum angolense TaxID=2727404 RepID=A0AAE1T3Y7_9LAMI|nr:hypothetical protein Sango_2997200 [Sesamum angolense]
MMRDLDLNSLPPSEDVNTNLELGLPSVQVTANQNTNNDEVTIISQRHFEQVSSSSRRNQRMFRYIDARYHRGHIASRGNNDNSLHTLRTTQLVDGVYGIPQWEDHVIKYEDVPEVPPPMQQRASMFNCPLCLEEQVEETSTKCGHVFCRRCIVEALTNEKNVHYVEGS